MGTRIRRYKLSAITLLALTMLWLAPPAWARTITDAAGRTVEIPDLIARVLPAGPPAALLLFTLAPRKMLGWAHKPHDDALALLDPAAAQLPELGALTHGDEIDSGLIRSQKPDLILDIGTVSPRYRDLADRVQKETGVPYLLLDGSLARTPGLYRQLGEILDETATADRLAAEADRILAQTRQAVAASSVPRPSAYYGRNENGLAAVGPASISAEPLALLGLANVVPADQPRGDIEASTLLAWNPALVLTMSESFALRLRTDAAFASLAAVEDQRVLLLPKLPFGWIDEPPSVNRLLGLLWLGHKLHPAGFTDDLRTSVRSFFHDFYRRDLSEAELDRILQP
ncbi:MAG TPA: ABC transporter substrate-binding protein [Hypericibacter adhaerens]|uniref:ABC transporter substrate-binding protein n=1 Tax=Hypericibacter adhaerens TaxID=2602016 RepID=UPI002BCCA257|nr:ABC transporter substrate-binding protein [Hypericibacter adhaerens]HWA42532.1 ABC transporter substrate-binding protein [Hypericibacter adhaerens]